MSNETLNRKIWLNGKIVDVNDATINVLAPTSQFGLNVFEGIPCFWSEDNQQLYAFRLDDHYKRLIKSANLLEIDIPYSIEQMKNAFLAIVKANNYKTDLSVRQTLFVEGFGSWGSEGPTGMFISPIPKKNTSSEYNKKGLSCCVSSYRRISESVLSPRIKCGANYINSRYGQREALRNGYDTCIFLNDNGKVSEGPGSCLFIVKDGVLITPLLTDSVLESITRDSIIKIALKNNIPVLERTIDRSELYVCDEAFLCGSAMGITPILSIDKHVLSGSSKTSSLVEMLRNKYFNICRGNDELFKEWLTEVYE